MPMVNIPQGPPPPPPPGTPTLTVDAPMAKVEAITVTVQVTNKPQQLPKHPNRLATVLAPTGNTATLYVGGPNVNSDSGFPLAAGQAKDLREGDLQSIWIFGTKGDKATIIVEWGVGVLAQ